MPILTLQQKRDDLRTILLGKISKQILAILCDRRCLRTRDFYRLIPRKDYKSEESHQRAIRAALQRLRDYGLEMLDEGSLKPEEPRKYYGFVRAVTWIDPLSDNRIEHTELVWGLTDRGVRLVRLREIGSYKLAKSFQNIKKQNVDHELGCELYRLSLEEHYTPLGLEVIFRDPGIKKEKGLPSPDRLYYLYHPINDIRTRARFLEWERKKRDDYDENGNPDIIQKHLAYEEFFNSERCQELFKFRKFDVTTVVTSEAKRQFLLENLAEKCCQPNFFVTTQRLVRESIGQPILKRPTDYRDTSYALHMDIL